MTVGKCCCHWPQVLFGLLIGSRMFAADAFHVVLQCIIIVHPFAMHHDHPLLFWLELKRLPLASHRLSQ